MKYAISIILISIILTSCSASYEKLKKINASNPNSYAEHLFKEYKDKAIFEAEMMHDWNSAKLYSEKALLAKNGVEIFPQEIVYWNLPTEHINEIKKGYENLMSVYSEAKEIDHYNLAVAISSLDCWSEQQEENWQIWDINNCRDDFLNSLHQIYEKITIKKSKDTLSLASEDNLLALNNNESVTLVTKNNNKEIMQIIYFDFDDSRLSNVSINTLKNFLNRNRKLIQKYIIIGHTDTKGSKSYNKKLSLKRAEAVKIILKNEGIKEEYINVLGKGEESPAISTPDDFKHPANRRAEIKIIN